MENKLIEERLKKIDELRESGVRLYGGKYKTDAPVSVIRENYEEGKKVSIAGRIIAVREHGKSAFADVRDGSGKIQAYFKKGIIGSEAYDIFKKLDIGDIVGLSGELLKTRTGEITVKVESFELLSKIVRVMPEKWHGLKDVEVRYRQRYIDLIANDESREKFYKRSKIISYIRNFLEKRGFIEVETPILQPIPGGAKADPFITHHNALHEDLYLRIAPELYLKKLLVGGFDKVFEIGKNFRNEGISVRHNPEFTMMELYQSYADYEDMMELTESLISELAVNFASEEVKYGDLSISFKRPWKRMTFFGALLDATGVDFRKEDPVAFVKNKPEFKDEYESLWGEEDCLDFLFDTYVLPKLINPTFITDYPVSMTPLAKRKEDAPSLVYRFELFIAGFELANAYSELNDPFEQRRRFEKQKVALGEDKAIDYDFITALEYGMPPAGGLGIGIDRLIMLLTGSHSIRDVILFPQLKSKDKDKK